MAISAKRLQQIFRLSQCLCSRRSWDECCLLRQQSAQFDDNLITTVSGCGQCSAALNRGHCFSKANSQRGLSETEQRSPHTIASLSLTVREGKSNHTPQRRFGPSNGRLALRIRFFVSDEGWRARAVVSGEHSSLSPQAAAILGDYLKRPALRIFKFLDDVLGHTGTLNMQMLYERRACLNDCPRLQRRRAKAVASSFRLPAATHAAPSPDVVPAIDTGP